MQQVDPFTAASPVFRAAQRTNQARHASNYDFRMESIVDKSPLWIRVLEVTFRPTSVFSLALLGLCVFVMVNY